MDSPLNLAHQQSRKADVLVRNGKFDDATECHKRAAEYLLAAMQQTSSIHALESLRLQHQHHLRQQDLIVEKCLRIERAQKAQKSLENRTNQSCQTDDIVFSDDTVDGNFHSGHFDEKSLYQTMTHTDTLLAFLDKRKTSQDQLDQDGSSTSKMTLVPKDDKTVIEELQVHNEDLQRHVKLLLKELDRTKKENDELIGRLREKENLRHIMSEPVFSPDHFTPFDLPPLEMPTLNLDMLKEGLQSDSTLDDI